MLTRIGPAPYLIFHAPGQGAIARYHLDKAQIDGILDDLHGSGAEGISLSPWVMQDARKLGTDGQFLDWWGDSQAQANFANLLLTIKEKGFNFVQVAPQFYGATNPREVGFDQSFQPNWNAIVGMTYACQSSGLDWLIDVCPEVNSGAPNVACCYKEVPEFKRYVDELWVNVTGAFYPNARPCWRFSMSFIPGNAEVLTEAFQGNVPVVLVPHIYRGEQQRVHDDLVEQGLGGRLWLIGECMSLTRVEDEQIARDWAGWIERTRQPVVGFCPWPIDPRVPVGSDVQISVVPPAGVERWEV